MENTNIAAKIAEGHKYATITDKSKPAKSAKGGKYVGITGKKLNAKSVKDLKYAPITDKNINAKSVKGLKYAPITDKKLTARSANPIKVNIEQWIFNSRQYDKMRNIYDADRFIDKCFLEGLVEDYKQCYYGDCKVNLHYTEYQDDLATIERLDNSIGHIKSNCVLCCMKCNKSSKSEKKAALMRQLNLF